jgi:hypothetical protein
LVDRYATTREDDMRGWLRACIVTVQLLLGSAPASAHSVQSGAGGATQGTVPGRAQRIALTDEWVMSQHSACGEVRGRFRALAPGTADTVLRPVAGVRALWVGPSLALSHGVDTAVTTRDDGVFHLRAPATGTWRLYLSRAGLPDVFLPLVFAPGGGYVVEIAVAARDEHDERWGTTYQVVRAAQACGGIGGGGLKSLPTSAFLDPAWLAAQSFDRVSRVAVIAAVVSTAFPYVRRWRASRRIVCADRALDTAGAETRVLAVVDGIPLGSPADSVVRRAVSERVVMKRELRRTSVSIGGTEYGAILLLSTRPRRAQERTRCDRPFTVPGEDEFLTIEFVDRSW